MAVLTSTDLLKVLRNTYKRVHSKDKAQAIDVKKRPWIRFLESKKEESGFEGGVIIYPLVLSFNDPGQTWAGDDEIEAHDPDFSLNMEFGYFNYTTAIIIKHDLLKRLGFSVVPNGSGHLASRAMGGDMAFKIQNYVKNLVKKFKDNHDQYLDRLLLRSGAASPTDPVGLFGMLTEDPTTGTIGGLSRVTYSQLRHTRQTGLTPTAGGDFRSLWSNALRAANVYSNSNGVDGEIDFYMAGKQFIEQYKVWGELNGYRVNREIGPLKSKFDFAIPDTSLHFEDVPIIYNPSMDALDTVDTFSPVMEKLCVGVNSKTVHYKSLPGIYKTLSSPQDPPKQRITREDIDTTAHLHRRAG